MAARLETLLALTGVELAFGGTVVLAGVDLSVGVVGIHAVIGPNGAGKSSLIKVISALYAPDAGSVRIGDTTFARVPRNGSRGSAWRAPSRNLVTGGLGRGSNRAAIRADLERVFSVFPRLIEKRRALTSLIIGGEQQVVADGRALIGRPRLLVLNEPSMGLAPKIVSEIFHTLVRLNRDDGLTLLLAEQNVTVALRHADRPVVLENGLSVLAGKAAELRARDDVKAFYLRLGAVVPDFGAVANR